MSCREETCCDTPLAYKADVPPVVVEDQIVFANIGDYGTDEGNTDKEAVADLVKSWNPEYITTNGGNWYGTGITLPDWQGRGANPYEDYIGSDAVPLPLLNGFALDAFINALDGPADGISGLTYSPVTGTLFAIRNVSSGQSATYEYDLKGVLLRTITHANFTDTEGICWMYGNTFAISEENAVNRITIVTIVDGQTTLDRNDFLATSFATGLVAGNLGIEGCGYDQANDLLYFTTEKALAGVWQLWSMNPSTGAVSAVVDITSAMSGVATDISDIYYDRRSGNVFLLSDESNKVIEMTLAAVVVRTLDITNFTQPEGLAFTDDMRFMWVTGEPRQWARYRNNALPVTNFYPATGNHDRDPAGHKAAFGYFNYPLVFREDLWLPSNGYYEVRRGFIHHFFFDSGYDSSQVNQQADGLGLTSKQGLWLRSQLAVSNARWKVVHIHHPGYTSTPTVSTAATLVGNGYLAYSAMRDLINVLRSWGADVVFHGHARNYERLNVGGLPVIVNGAGGNTLDAFDTAISESVLHVSEFGAGRGTATCRTFTWEWYNVDGVRRDVMVLTKS